MMCASDARRRARADLYSRDEHEDSSVQSSGHEEARQRRQPAIAQALATKASVNQLDKNDELDDERHALLDRLVDAAGLRLDGWLAYHRARWPGRGSSTLAMSLSRVSVRSTSASPICGKYVAQVRRVYRHVSHASAAR
eukprot:374389-Prymnesium_polylepis.1